MERYRVKDIGCRHNKYSSVIGLIKYYHYKMSFRKKFASTISNDKQEELTNSKKLNNKTILGKIYGYFFDN